MRRALVVVMLVACGAIFRAKREKPPDKWSLEAAATHSMMSTPAPFMAGDCSAAPMPDLQFFCEKKCGDIGELSLKAYCTWDCDAVKNPDLGVFCNLEVKRSKKHALAPAACDGINAETMKALCKRWVTSLSPSR
jgi:hypothetical protein